MKGSKEILQQSSHWEKYQDHSGLVDGYPFNEGFPIDYPGKYFELVCRSGDKTVCFVDDNHQYEDTGLMWRSRGGNLVSKRIVAAWRELKEESEVLVPQPKPEKLEVTKRASGSSAVMAHIDLSRTEEGRQFVRETLDPELLLKDIRFYRRRFNEKGCSKSSVNGHRLRGWKLRH